MQSTYDLTYEYKLYKGYEGDDVSKALIYLYAKYLRKSTLLHAISRLWEHTT